MVLNLDELLHALATNSPIPPSIPQRRSKSSKSSKSKSTKQSKSKQSLEPGSSAIKTATTTTTVTTATTTSACDRFFALPELLTSLINILAYPQISTLMQVNKQFKALCEPTFYRTVDLSSVKGHTRSDALEAVQALGRNTRHVRVFSTDFMFASIYMHSVAIGLAKAQTHKSQPFQFPPPIGRIPNFLKSMPFTPMSNLTRLHINMDNPEGAKDRPFYWEPPESNRERTSQLSWILQWSPLIEELKITHWQVYYYTEIQALPIAINRLSKLKILKFWIAIHRRYWHHFASTMYHCTSPKLEEFYIEFIDMADMMQPPSPIAGHIYADAAAERNKSRRGPAEWKIAAPRRQGPLSDLKVLAAPALLVDAKKDMASYLEQSPDLEFLSIPQLGRTVTVNDVLHLVKQHCLKLHSIAGSEIQVEQVAKVIPGLMQQLPEQRVKQLFWAGFQENPATDYKSLFRRHSTSIQRIYLNLCRDISSKTIQAILCECTGLEEFSVLPHNHRSSTKIDLVDSVTPWVCTRLKTLVLTVAFPDLRPFMHGRDGTHKCYYDRSAPFFLTWDEREQFEELEKLYRNIGSLTKLENLTLYAKPIPPANAPADAIEGSACPEDWWIRYRYFTFPGLLSLGDAKSGRPGYLHLLKNLTNLQELMGSVSIDAKETIKTVRWDEIEFMDKHFPKLMKTEFLQFGKATVEGTSWHEPIAWLLRRRPGFKQSMYGLPAPQRSGC